jgi:hypothetical protein
VASLPYQSRQKERGPLRRDWMPRYKDYDYSDRYGLRGAKLGDIVKTFDDRK